MWLDRLVQSIYWKVMAKPHAPMTPEQRGALVLRDALPPDLARLAQLHVDTYNETHVGPFGSGPTFAVREWQWREHLAKLHATSFVLVFESPSGEFVGFAWFHATLGEKFASRLNKIYVRRSHQRQGLGHALVKAGVDRLLANGITSMFLFTEVDNIPACSFYEKLGGERQLGDDGKFHGKYGWPDLAPLKERLSG
jgi:ribosomal protein S18 acetylase RimI-like enzyme